MISKRFNTRHAIAYCLLLFAFALRVSQLDSLPPGLTHDEANHGHEAIEVLSGFFRYYFPLGYGREPLYAYLLAGWMRLLGVSIFSLRLLIPVGMTVCHAAVYRWADRLFGRNVALLTLAILAVGWWPLVASRQALRSGLLPLITIGLAAATYKIWIEAEKEQPIKSFFRQIRWPIAGIAVLIGLMLHTYIAARVLWVFIPAFGLYLLLINLKAAGRFWLGATPAVVGGLLLSAPLFVYLQNNPGLETRLEMLDGPLLALRSGEIGPIVQNVWRTVLGLFWPGAGDRFLAYNIPGKPTLAPLTAIFLGIGLLKALFRWRTPKYTLLILWIGVGLAPSLITGPTAATTRSIGALVPIYLLAALGICFFNSNLVKLLKIDGKPFEWGVRYSLMLVWVLSAAVFSIPAYFADWGQRPDVRAAYQSTLIAGLAELPDVGPDQGRMISSVLPGHAHDPTIAEIVVGRGELEDVRWADGRFALIYQAEVNELVVLAPSSADLHPQFQEWILDSQRSDMRPDDLDPYWTRYNLRRPIDQAGLIADFNGAITLNEARWLAETVPPNGVAELLTVWTVVDPNRLGATIPYVGLADTNLFVHVLRPDGTILAQADRLDAPSWDWEAGDMIVQVHQIYIGGEVDLGEYETLVGVYDRITNKRLAIDATSETTVALPDLVVK